jgi:hypothetical protein
MDQQELNLENKDKSKSQYKQGAIKLNKILQEE